MGRDYMSPAMTHYYDPDTQEVIEEGSADDPRSHDLAANRFGKRGVPGCKCTYRFTCGACLRAAGPTK